MVQTVQKNREDSAYVLGHGCLARRCYNDRCRMVDTVQKTVESPQLVLQFSVSVDGRHSSGDGFSDVMDYEQFWRRRPCCVELFCVVCPGECGASFEPEVLGLLFCERRMRCGQRMVQFLLLAVDGLGSRILLLGQGC